MTNREKYIDNASNEKLAFIIMSKISTMPRFSNIDGFTDAGRELIEWLSQEVEPTADEMFEELGYIKENEFSGCIEYWCDEYKKRITIDWNDEATHFAYQKSRGNNSLSDTITEEEDKAIHKKIEELKNKN